MDLRNQFSFSTLTPHETDALAEEVMRIWDEWRMMRALPLAEQNNVSFVPGPVNTQDNLETLKVKVAELVTEEDHQKHLMVHYRTQAEEMSGPPNTGARRGSMFYFAWKFLDTRRIFMDVKLRRMQAECNVSLREIEMQMDEARMRRNDRHHEDEDSGPSGGSVH